jgi:hypothetical protein
MIKIALFAAVCFCQKMEDILPKANRTLDEVLKEARKQERLKNP